MTKLFHKALLAGAFGLTFMALPAFAQEDHDTHEAEAVHEAETHAEDVAEAAPVEEEEVSIAGQVQLSALIFEHMSRGVLAMEGDRDTADIRRDVSVWLDHLAGQLEADVHGLARAEATLDTAQARAVSAAADMRVALNATLSEAMAELDTVREQEMPRALAMRLNEVEDLLDAIEEAALEAVPMRELIIDMNFAEPMEEDVRQALVSRLISFQTEHGVLIDFDRADLSQNMHLEGEAPATMSTLELRTALTALYEEYEGGESEDGEPAEALVDVPAPSFIGITLN